MGGRKERPVPTLSEIGTLLAVSQSPLRAAIGLAAGAGLRVESRQVVYEG